MMKICTKCLQEKPLDSFYKRSDQIGKYTSHCKACKRAHDNAHNNKPEVKKARSEYSKNRRKNPEIIAKEQEYKYKYNRLPDVRERKKIFQRVRRLDPKVIANERMRDSIYAKENPHLFAAKTRKRKAAKLQRTPPWLNVGHWLEIDSIYELCAAWRSVGFDYTVDHIVPLQGKTVSGLHVPWNLQILSKSENSAKGNRVW